MSNIIEGITKDLKAIPKNLKAKAGGMEADLVVGAYSHAFDAALIFFIV